MFDVIGVDTAKNVFQLHGVDHDGAGILRKKIKREEFLPYFQILPRSCVGMEACAASHHWARQLTALGHDVKLIPAHYVKPFVKRAKNDATDAAAICEAMRRPDMAFVPMRSAENQAALGLLTMRGRLIRQRTQFMNAARGFMAEFGITAPRGHCHIEPLLEQFCLDKNIPDIARELGHKLYDEWSEHERRTKAAEEQLKYWVAQNECIRRLADIPGIGPVAATLLVLKAPDPHYFRSGRDLAAWVGLTPRDHSTSGKTRLGAITR